MKSFYFCIKSIKNHKAMFFIAILLGTILTTILTSFLYMKIVSGLWIADSYGFQSHQNFISIQGAETQVVAKSKFTYQKWQTEDYTRLPNSPFALAVTPASTTLKIDDITVNVTAQQEELFSFYVSDNNLLSVEEKLEFESQFSGQQVMLDGTSTLGFDEILVTEDFLKAYNIQFSSIKGKKLTLKMHDGIFLEEKYLLKNVTVAGVISQSVSTVSNRFMGLSIVLHPKNKLIEQVHAKIVDTHLYYFANFADAKQAIENLKATDTSFFYNLDNQYQRLKLSYKLETLNDQLFGLVAAVVCVSVLLILGYLLQQIVQKKREEYQLIYSLGLTLRQVANVFCGMIGIALLASIVLAILPVSLFVGIFHTTIKSLSFASYPISYISVFYAFLGSIEMIFALFIIFYTILRIKQIANKLLKF